MVDFIVLAKSSTQQAIAMTQAAIDSLLASSDPSGDFSKGRILVVESQSPMPSYRGATSVPYDREMFNYNHALNIGIQKMQKEQGEHHWLCFANNDVLFQKDWLEKIQEAHLKFPEVESFSPRCAKECNDEVAFGYTLGRHLQGFCFVCNHLALDVIGGAFDETFDFYFQDDDYLEELRRHGIKHACVKSAIVKHLGQQTTGREDMRKLFADRDKFIAKWSLQTYLQREAEKQQ